MTLLPNQYKITKILKHLADSTQNVGIALKISNFKKHSWGVLRFYFGPGGLLLKPQNPGSKPIPIFAIIRTHF